MQKQLIGRPQLLRDLNYRAVLESIAAHGSQSRVEVAKRLNLSQPSVSRIADALLQADLIVEGKRIASKAGRRQVLLDLNPDAAVVAGLSIRSKHVRLLLTDLKGKILTQKEVVRESSTVQALVKQIKNLLDEERQPFGAPLAAVSVGILGVWNDRAQVVHSANNLSYLEKVDLLALLKNELKDEFLQVAVSIDNDVNYAALGEYAFGAAQDVNSFFYLNLGSGVGGGIVVKGQLYRGMQGFAGELGFLPIYHQGRYQPLETLVSSSAINAYAQANDAGQSAQELFKLAQAGHQKARDGVSLLCNYLALALCSIKTVLDPELIVIGGSTGRYSNILIPSLNEHLSAFLPELPNLAGTALGVDASLRGAVAKSLELARANLITKELL